MKFSVIIPGTSSLDDLADEVTHVVWDVVTSKPALHRLYPGYFVAIHSVVARHLHEAAATVTRGHDGRLCVVFEGPDDEDLFEVKLAGAVVVRLDEVLRQARALDLINREIPVAVSRALHAHGCDCAAGQDGFPAARPAVA